MLRIERPVAATAAEFHHREVPAGDDVLLWWFDPVAPAIVLGSTQSEGLLDLDACAARGVDVVKRHSGGGLVLVSARHTLWADVILPGSHPAWCHDVGRASEWMGEIWLDALERTSSTDPDHRFTLHRGAYESSTWSKLVCFAGRGPGEIFDERGRKVVGISQRRTRRWARFQCALSLLWEPAMFVDLVADGPSASDIADAGHTVGANFDAGRVREAFTASLDAALRTAAS